MQMLVSSSQSPFIKYLDKYIDMILFSSIFYSKSFVELFFVCNIHYSVQWLSFSTIAQCNVFKYGVLSYKFIKDNVNRIERTECSSIYQEIINRTFLNILFSGTTVNYLQPDHVLVDESCFGESKSFIEIQAGMDCESIYKNVVFIF